VTPCDICGRERETRGLDVLGLSVCFDCFGGIRWGWVGQVIPGEPSEPASEDETR